MSHKENRKATSILLSHPLHPDEVFAAAALIKHDTQLIRLDLNGTSLKDRNTAIIAEAIGESASLRELSLMSNGIRCSGAGALAAAFSSKNSQIYSIDLRDNKISDRGAVLIAAALPLTKAVREIDLQDNTIGDAGAIALAKALERSPQITFLGLRSNRLSTAARSALLPFEHILDLDLMTLKKSAVRGRHIVGPTTAALAVQSPDAKHR